MLQGSHKSETTAAAAVAKALRQTREPAMIIQRNGTTRTLPFSALGAASRAGGNAAWDQATPARSGGNTQPGQTEGGIEGLDMKNPQTPPKTAAEAAADAKMSDKGMSDKMMDMWTAWTAGMSPVCYGILIFVAIVVVIFIIWLLWRILRGGRRCEKKDDCKDKSGCATKASCDSDADC